MNETKWMELSIFFRVGMDGTGCAVRRWREGRDRSEHANTRNGQAGTNGKAVFLLGLLITTAAVLHGEPNWPRLSPERWRDMTADELQRLLNGGKDITQRDGVGMTALIRATRETPIRRLCSRCSIPAEARRRGASTVGGR